jgi:hypothetical protein
MVTTLENCRAFKDWLQRGWGQGGEMNQALYAHMNNKRKMKKKKKIGF